MSIEFIENVKRSISSSLPTASSIVGEVIKTIYDPSTNARDLAAIIEHDPPLTAKVLKVANSAYFGTTTEINSLTRAIVVLGFDTIKELVVTITVVQGLFSPGLDCGINRVGLWQHSVGTAKAAQLISNQTRIGSSNIAYTVGLLHDIGKILLALSFPDHYREVIKLAQLKQCRIILAERKLLNTDHCMIGKLICDIWGLPENISSAIFFHHDLKQSPKRSLKITQIIHLGNIFCRRAQIGDPGDEVVPDPSQAALALLGDNPDKIKDNYAKFYKDFMATKDDIIGFFEGLK